MGLPEVRIVVEVSEGAWVEEFGGIEVPVRVEMGDVGVDAVVGTGDVAAEEIAGVGDVGTEAAMGAGDVAAEETAAVGAVGTEAAVGAGDVAAEKTVTGKATRAVGAIEGMARPGRAGAVEGAFTLRVTILGSAGVTVGLLAIVVAISKEEKLWSGSRMMAFKMFSSAGCSVFKRFSSATVRSWGWKPGDRLRRELLGGGP